MNEETAIEQQTANEQKWSKDLMQLGWTAVPNFILENQREFGLDSLDLNIILHIIRHWWTRDNKPWPSKRTIADAIGIEPRTAQRRIAKMEAAGLIRREERRIRGRGSRSNRYHFDGLIAEAQLLAVEKLKNGSGRSQARLNARHNSLPLNTPSDTNKVVENDDYVRLGFELTKMAGLDNAQARHSIGIVKQWLDSGATEEMLWKIIGKSISRGFVIDHLGYFDKAICEELIHIGRQPRPAEAIGSVRRPPM